MSTYRTISGDTWDMISYRVYGTSEFMPLLIEANVRVAETTVFAAGIVLNVPEKPAEAASDLPPWKLVEL